VRVSYLYGLVQLARPVNGLITWASVTVGALLPAHSSRPGPILLAGLSAAFVASGGNAINDYFDADIDRINKPHRPIPSGRVPRETAFVWAAVLCAAGLSIAGPLGPVMFSVAVAATALLVIYSWKLKRKPYWGNATVSITAALAFLYGGIVVSNPVPALVPAGFALLFHFGRELIKDVEDMAADATVSAQTAPVRHGRTTALAVATGALGLLVGVTLCPYFFGLYGSAYLFIVLLGVDPVLVYVILALWRNSTAASLARLSLVLKADMSVGLLALILGKMLR